METCCFTGHRELPVQLLSRLETALQSEVQRAIRQGYTHFLCGFARGADLLFAKAVARECRTNPNIRLPSCHPLPRAPKAVGGRSRNETAAERLLRRIRPQRELSPRRVYAAQPLHGGPLKAGDRPVFLWARGRGHNTHPAICPEPEKENPQHSHVLL